MEQYIFILLIVTALSSNSSIYKINLSENNKIYMQLKINLSENNKIYMTFTDNNIFIHNNNYKYQKENDMEEMRRKIKITENMNLCIKNMQITGEFKAKDKNYMDAKIRDYERFSNYVWNLYEQWWHENGFDYHDAVIQEEPINTSVLNNDYTEINGYDEYLKSQGFNKTYEKYKYNSILYSNNWNDLAISLDDYMVNGYFDGLKIRKLSNTQIIIEVEKPTDLEIIDYKNTNSLFYNKNIVKIISPNNNIYACLGAEIYPSKYGTMIKSSEGFFETYNKIIFDTSKIKNSIKNEKIYLNEVFNKYLSQNSRNWEYKDINIYETDDINIKIFHFYLPRCLNHNIYWDSSGDYIPFVTENGADYFLFDDKEIMEKIEIQDNIVYITLKDGNMIKIQN